MLLSPSEVSQSAPADWRPPGSFKGPSPVPSCVGEAGRRAERVCPSRAWNRLTSGRCLRHCSHSMEPRGPDGAPHRQDVPVLPATRSLTHRQQERELLVVALLLYSLPDSKPSSGSHKLRQQAGKQSEAEEAPDGGGDGGSYHPQRSSTAASPTRTALQLQGRALTSPAWKPRGASYIRCNRCL